MRKIFDRILLAALALALIAALVPMVSRLLDHRRGEQDYAQAEEIAGAPDLPAAPAGTAATPSEKPGEGPDEEDAVLAALAEIDLEALREVNEDVIGWICIPGTDLSYPLLQGSDNAYYLSHTWQKKESSAGAVFLDYRSDLDDPYFLIYAHRMSNTTMFGTLKFYNDREFWAGHPSVYLVSEGAVKRYDIFSAFEASVYSDVYKLDLPEADREGFLTWRLEQSVIDTGLTPDAAEKTICLSTCISNFGVADTRWVVHAVLRDEAAVAR